MRKRLLSLYPEAWRDRYGEEMSALLDQTAPSVTGTLDLLRGAVAAHIRPLVSPSPLARARGTISYVLGCFIVFCFFGAAFAKTTENYDSIEHVHPLLGVSHSVVLIAAVAGAGTLALAAAPLALASLALARRERDPVVIKLIATPPAAIAIFGCSVELLALWLNAHQHHAGLVGWLLLGVCALAAALGGIACWAASRALMRRINRPTSAFAFSVTSISLVPLCMTAIATAIAVFLVGILAEAPRVGAAGNGPAQLINVTTSIAIQCAAMLGLSAVAMVSAARGVRSIRAL